MRTGRFNNEEPKPKKTLEDFVRYADDVEDVCEAEIEQVEEKETAPEYEQNVKKRRSDEFFLQGTDEIPKWMNKLSKIWYATMSLVWFLVSCLTYSPILFISDKIYPMIKDKKKSFLFGAIIHIVILVLIFILLFVRRSPTVE